jgi:hypothetical protein
MLQRLFTRQNLHIYKIQRALQVRQNLAQHIRLHEWQLALERRLGAKLGNPFLYISIRKSAKRRQNQIEKKKKKKRITSSALLHAP